MGTMMLVLLLVAAVPASGEVTPDGSAAGAPPLAQPAIEGTPRTSCTGEYADDLAALSARAREFEQQQKPYTFCIRTSAVYECPSYGADRAIRKSRRTVVAHGTGFAYRRDGNDTLLVTNDHVAEWPAVTDDDHVVGDVPKGCRRVSDKLRIVDDEGDTYVGDDIPLARVATDPQLDLAILCSRTPLPVMPWKIGRSATLRERNVVDVRGFPLGVLRANNVGKVVSAYDHDDAQDWDHDDFVVDALLSPGNSGSPVLAVSCRTGEFELVGVFHAGYERGSALNVVVAIDQARDLMLGLKRSPRPRTDVQVALDATARARLVASAGATPDPYFAFGTGVAAARTRDDGALVFELMSPEFPIRTTPALALEDLPADGAGFGELGRTWVGSRRGLHLLDRASLDAEAQSQLVRLLEALRRDALAAFTYRDEAHARIASRQRLDGLERLERSVRKAAAARSDLVQAVLDLASDWSADLDDGVFVSMADVLRVPEARAEAAAAWAVPASTHIAAQPEPGTVVPTGPRDEARGSPPTTSAHELPGS